MAYSFCCSNKGMIYFETGFDSFRNAKFKLEEIAAIYCRQEGDKAHGRVDKIKDKKVKIIKKYDISFKNKKISFKKKK